MLARAKWKGAGFRLVAAGLAGLLVAMGPGVLAEGDGCPCGDEDETVSTHIEGRIEVTGSVTIKVRNTSNELLHTEVVTGPSGGGPVEGSIQIPIPWGDEPVKVEFEGPAGAGDNFGLRLGGGFLIWRSSEGDWSEGSSVGRPGDWLGKGSSWWVKRTYPFPHVTGEFGQFELGLPRLVTPGYTDYDLQEEAVVSWILRFGEGGSLEISGELESGSTVHTPSSIRFWPATGNSHVYTGYGTGGGDQYVFAKESTPGTPPTPPASPLYVAEVLASGDTYTISIYEGSYLSGLGPFLNVPSSTFLWESFTVAKIDSTYEYAVRIQKGGGVESEFHGSASVDVTEQTNEFSALVLRYTGVGVTHHEEEVSSSVTAGVRTLHRIRRENTGGSGPTVLSDVEDRYKIVTGQERMISRKETVDGSSTERLTDYTWKESGSGPALGKLLKVEHKYGGVLTGWRAYSYEAPSTDVYRVHEFTPWKDIPATPPGTANPASFTGKLITREYQEATSTVPRRLLKETTKVKAVGPAGAGTKISETINAYETEPDGGIPYDLRREWRYTASGVYLESLYVTWPREFTPASSADRHWALAPRYTQAPDNTKVRYTYSGGGASATVTTSWNESLAGLVGGKSIRTLETLDTFGRTTHVQTDLYIGSTWHTAVTSTTYNYGSAGWPVSTFIDGKMVEDYTYPADGEVNQRGLEGIWSRRTYDRLGRLIEEIRDAGGGVAQNVTSIVYTGLETERRRTGGSLSLSTTTETDRLGRMILSKDEQTLPTTYAYDVATGRMRTTETRPGGITQRTDVFLDGRTKSVTDTAVVATFYDYQVDTSSGQTIRKEYEGVDAGPRYTSTYLDWAGRISKTVQPAVSYLISKDYSYFVSGLPGQVGHLKSIESTGDTILGRQVYDYNSNGELLLSGVEPAPEIDQDGMPTPNSLEELTRQETTYVQAGAGNYWRRTDTWLYDQGYTAHLRKLTTSAERIGGDAYVEQSYTVNYTDNDGTYGVVTTRKHSVVNRSSATAKTETVQRDLTGFDPATFSGGTQIGYTAVQEYTHGYLQRESSFTVQAWTNYDYDDLGRLTHESNPRTGGNTVTAYWADELDAGRYTGKVMSVTDALGYATLYYYYTGESGQPAGALKLETNAAGKHTRYQYNSRGQLTHMWGHTGYPVRYDYDGTYGDRTHMWTYKGGSGWTGDSWPSATTGTADQTLWTYHAASGLLTGKTDALGRTVSYSYHSGTALVSRRTWARNIQTDYTYNWTGRLTMEDHSDSTPDVTYAYDRMGRLQTLHDDAGQHAFTESVASGNRTSTETVTASSGGNRTSVLAGAVATAVADKWGRRTNFDASRSGAVLSDLGYTYQATTSRLDEVTATFPTIDNHSGKYAYATNADLVASVQHKKASTVKLTQTRTWHSTIDRLETIGNTVSGGTVSSHNYLYDNLHRRTKATAEDATFWDYVYNDRSEVLSGTKKLSGGAAINGWSFSYGYDNIGNRTNFYAGSEWAAYSSYNALNQPGSISGGATYNVKGRTESTGSPSVKVDTYTQNVTTQTAGTKKYFIASVTAGTTPDYQFVEVIDGTQSSTYYKFVPPSSYGPQYDLDGNLIQDDRWNYTWDANNRLVSMDTRSEVVYVGGQDLRLDFKYDAFGRRVEKKLTLTYYGVEYLQYTDIYIYDGWNLIARVKDAATDQTQRYVWGLDLSGTLQEAGGVGGLLMVYTEQNTTKTVHFPAYDGNGNIMSLVNASTSAVEADYAYDPFGGLQRVRGTSNVEWDNPFRFSTKYTDDESGHLYYGYRYLDPRHGRWLGRDPIGEEGGLNLYGFLGNDGIDGWDVLGQREARRQVDSADGRDFHDANDVTVPYSSTGEESRRYNYVVSRHPLRALQDLNAVPEELRALLPPHYQFESAPHGNLRASQHWILASPKGKTPLFSGVGGVRLQLLYEGHVIPKPCKLRWIHFVHRNGRWHERPELIERFLDNPGMGIEPWYPKANSEPAVPLEESTWEDNARSPFTHVPPGNAADAKLRNNLFFIGYVVAFEYNPETNTAYFLDGFRWGYSIQRKAIKK